MVSGFDVVAIQDNIVARVKLEIPDTTVLEDTIPDDFSVQTDPATGTVIPYVVLRFGPIRPSYTGRSMRGPRHDEYWASFDVMAISGNGRVSRLLNAGLVDMLIGFKPDGVSPIQMRTDAGEPAQFVVAHNESRPTQMVSSTRLRYNVNNVAVGLPVGEGFGAGPFGVEGFGA